MRRTESTEPGERVSAKELADKLVRMQVAPKGIGVSRMIGHYTNQGILEPLGGIHTGTGRSRFYGQDAILQAAIIFRLSALGVPVGVMKELFAGLRAQLRRRYPGMTLTKAARQLSDPCIYLVIPDHKKRTLHKAARLLERDSIDTKPDEIDVVMIQLNRFL